jgi:hypothetical protein
MCGDCAADNRENEEYEEEYANYELDQQME